MNSSQRTRALIESAMMVALATVLSIIKIIEMPYGGSVTIASALPIAVLAYRHGTKVGLGAGVVYALLQQLLGLKTLAYFTTWQSVVAIILLDYLVAFTVFGLGGIFKKSGLQQKNALLFGVILTTVLRYICHVISGATVWAGLSIPTEAALAYSLGYNATYMLPEGIILAACAYYLGSVIDFTRPVPERMAAKELSDGAPYFAVSGLSLLFLVIADTTLIAPVLQDTESGEFTLKYLAEVSWLAVIIITVLCLAISILFFLLAKRARKK